MSDGLVLLDDQPAQQDSRNAVPVGQRPAICVAMLAGFGHDHEMDRVGGRLLNWSVGTGAASAGVAAEADNRAGSNGA